MAETLSPTFVGFTFQVKCLAVINTLQEVAEICFLRLNLLLVAIEARKYEGGAIEINPNGKKETPNAIGIFVSDSSDKVKRAWFFCRLDLSTSHVTCHMSTSHAQGVSREPEGRGPGEEVLVQAAGQGQVRVLHLRQGGREAGPPWGAQRVRREGAW